MAWPPHAPYLTPHMHVFDPKISVLLCFVGETNDTSKIKLHEYSIKVLQHVIIALWEEIKLKKVNYS